MNDDGSFHFPAGQTPNLPGDHVRPGTGKGRAEGEDTETTRVLGLLGLMKQLPVFDSHRPAIQALELGRKPRAERPLQWLTDLELAVEREEAQFHSDRATRRLDEAIAEQDTRRRESDEGPDSSGR